MLTFVLPVFMFVSAFLPCSAIFFRLIEGRNADSYNKLKCKAHHSRSVDPGCHFWFVMINILQNVLLQALEDMVVSCNAFMSLERLTVN
jgi:hypothetical protein